jgi:hypothetical protein
MAAWPALSAVLPSELHSLSMTVDDTRFTVPRKTVLTCTDSLQSMRVI